MPKYVPLIIEGKARFRREDIQQIPDNISGIYMVFQEIISDGERAAVFMHFGHGNIKEGLLKCLDDPSLPGIKLFQSCAYWRDKPESDLQELIDYYMPSPEREAHIYGNYSFS